MSQTETLLLFILGFAVALFVVLLFGRGLWALMGSWSGWREARKVPAAIRELQAERDSLKAEKAMMAQKLEATVNDMKMRMAEQMAEVSRSRNRLLDLGQSLKEREDSVAHYKQQSEDRQAQILALQAQVEENVKAINLAYAKVAQKDDEMGKLRDMPSTATVVNGTPTPNNFERRFAAIAGNPLVDVNPSSADSEDVDRSVSNVLSLAERVRGLQTGMKKP
jgi:hypothetical protein